MRSVIEICLNCGSSLIGESGHPTESRQTAFDPSHGRIWEICPNCGFWNLHPMEERWELLERLEQQFAEARSRVSNGAIAQAETASGGLLFRLGNTQLPDLARFRYLDSSQAISRRRYRGFLLRLGLFGVSGFTVLMLGAESLSHALLRTFPVLSRNASLLCSGLILYALSRVAIRYWVRPRHRRLDQKPVVTVVTDSGPAVVRWCHLRLVKICSSAQDMSWSLRIVSDKGEQEMCGPAAEFYVSLLHARVGMPLYSKSEIEQALRLIDASGGASAFLDSFAREGRSQSNSSGRTCIGLMQAPRMKRFAAAIAADECLDRRNTEADIESLRTAARSAGEIAGIADDLLLPSAVTDALQRLRSKLSNRFPSAS
jgi:hypothetical protein